MVAPLQGIRVVEVANWLAAPSAAALMADLGADVVKIENPVGDPWRTALMRGRKPDFDQETDVDAPFELDNRGKRGVALSLEATGASDVVKRMVSEVDIFITNLTAPRIARFDLTWEMLQQVNPRLIYVVLTGYGTRGPDNAMTAFDHSAFWSRSGIMGLIGEPDGPPMQCRPGQGDHTTTLNLLAATLAALRLRDMTGEGQFVEVTLQRTGAWTIGADVATSLILEDQPTRADRINPGNPLFNAYETADGRWLALVMPTPDRHWFPTCRAMGRSDWMADERFSTLMGRMEHTAELTKSMRSAFLTKDLDEWRPLLDAESLTWAPVAKLSEVINDPQLEAMNAWSEIDAPEGRFRTLNTPFDIAGADIGPRGPAPKTGQHTHEVLSELGLSDEELADLAAAGALG
jgi:crotonobetainyl-CoA:carnitine CoA-transferase CaiB-like acyl-CoA transferase